MSKNGTKYAYAYAHMQVFSVAQSCPTLCDPMNCSPPGSPVHEIFQARILEWVFIFDSNCVHIFPFLNTLFLYVFSIYVYTHTHTHTHTFDLWPSDTGEQWRKDQYGAGTTNDVGTVGQPLLQNKEIEPPVTPNTKINSRWITDLHIKKIKLVLNNENIFVTLDRK